MAKKNSAKKVLDGVVGKKMSASAVIHGGKKVRKPKMGWI